MSIYESTVSLLKELSEEELTAIHDLAVRYSDRKNTSNPFQPMTEEEMLASLAQAREDSAQGRRMDASLASAKLRGKYAL